VACLPVTDRRHEQVSGFLVFLVPAGDCRPLLANSCLPENLLSSDQSVIYGSAGGSKFRDFAAFEGSGNRDQLI